MVAPFGQEVVDMVISEPVMSSSIVASANSILVKGANVCYMGREVIYTANGIQLIRFIMVDLCSSFRQLDLALVLRLFFFSRFISRNVVDNSASTRG